MLNDDEVELSTAFFDESVDGWLSSFSSPHLQYKDTQGECVYSENYDPSTQSEDLYNCLLSFQLSNGNTYTEGIHTFVDFVSHPSINYCVNVSTNAVACPANVEFFYPYSLKIRAANGLINSDEYIIYNGAFPVGLHGTTSEEVGLIDNNNELPENYSFSFDPAINYSQLQLYNAANIGQGNGNGAVTINNVSVQCQTTALTGIETQMIGNIVQFTATNAYPELPFTQYLWNFGDGSSSIEMSPSHIYETYGTYKVCVDVYNQHGCCATFCDETVEIIPPSVSCPLSEGSIYIDATNENTNSFSDLVYMGLYQSGGSLTGQDIVVNGSFILDENFSFNGCNFYFESGAELIVRSPGKVQILASTLQGCNEMWKGITVEGDLQNPAHRFNFKYNTISDAFHAIEILDGANIQQRYNTFDTNYIGIFSPQNNGVKKSFYGSNITRSKFISTRQMLPQYPTQTGWSETTKYGIFIYDLNHIIVDSETGSSSLKNQFSGIRNGIFLNNTNALIKGCIFEDIQENDENGRGIIGFKIENLSVIENEFINVNDPIKLINGNSAIVKILSNDFQPEDLSQIENGDDIYIRNVHSSKINVEHNNFNNQSIAISNCNSLQRFRIHNNDFWGYEKRYTPIRLSGIHKIAGAEGTVSSNYIENNYNLTSSVRGLSLSNTDNFEIFENTIIAKDDGSANSVLFQFNQSERSLIHDNTLEFNQGGGRGFNVSLAPGNIYCCNSIENADKAFYFFGQNKESELRSSVFENSTNGIWLKDAEIGDQDLYGNLWTGSTISKAVFEVDNGEDDAYENSIFRSDPNQTGTYPMVVLPPDWYKPEFGSAYLCPNGNDDEDCGSVNWDGFNFNVPPPSGDPCDKILEELIALVGPEIYWHFQHQNDWVFFTYVFNNYQDIPLGLWDDCYLYVDRDVNIKTVAEYYHVDKRYKEAYLVSGNESLQLDQYQNDYESEIESLINLFLQIEDDDDYKVYMTDIINKQNSIASLSTQIENIRNAVRTRGESNLTILLNEVDNLPSDFDFLDKIKFVWKMKIKNSLYGFDDIKNNEWAQLRDIANSCVLENINAVYEAQSLLSLIGENDFSGNENCVSPENRTTSKQVADLKIYPNPSLGIFYLEFDETEILGFKVEIMDVNGRILNIESNLSPKNIDLSNERSGVYFVKILKDNSIIHHQKLIIIK